MSFLQDVSNQNNNEDSETQNVPIPLAENLPTESQNEPDDLGQDLPSYCGDLWVSI